MKGAKNDFSMTFFARNPAQDQSIDKQVLFLKYVHNTDKAIIWVKSHNISWDYANIYNRRSRTFIEQVYNPLSNNIALYDTNKKKNYGKEI